MAECKLCSVQNMGKRRSCKGELGYSQGKVGGYILGDVNTHLGV